MKIGILTQPLHNNYGGLLQAYALQHYLKRKGHDVITIDFSVKKNLRLQDFKWIILNIIRKYLLQQPVNQIFPLNDQRRKTISQNTKRFTAENIRTTQPIACWAEFEYVKQYHFDAYIVGSDQVWRPAYSPGISIFFLDFLGENCKAKRIAYAASFGVDHCDEFDVEMLQRCSELLQKFDAIGVREDSAVELCRKHFGVTAQHVIDPTLLLDKADYCGLVDRDNISVSAGNMMVYVLDKAPEKQTIISLIANERGLQPFTVMRDESSGIYPPVTQWLRGFMDAEYVVTDSFHGIALSIIFSKPFIAIGNRDRGLARFTSILAKFGLQDRLVFSAQEITTDKINKPIDFNAVNQLKAAEQEYAHEFLQQALREK